MATLAARVTALAQAVAADIKSLTTSVAAKLPLGGGTLSGAINEATPVTLASAATVNIGAAAANTLTISGTTTITAFDTIAAGARRTLRFSGALTLTYDATKLILPRAANITTGAGDVADFVSLGSGNWACIGYQRSSAASDRSDIGAAASGANTDISSITGNAATASKLATARTLSFTGDATGNFSFDGSANASAALTLPASGATAGTYPKVTINAKGLVTSGGALAASDIPSLNTSILTAGILPVARGGTGNANGSSASWSTARTLSFTGDATGSVSLDGSADVSAALTLPASGATAGTYAKVTITAKGLVTAGAALAAGDIPSLSTDILTSGVLPAARGGTGNSNGTAAALTTARTLALTGDGTASLSFNGSANVSGAFTLANSGVTAGTFGSVTVNAKGLVTGGSAITPVANGGTGNSNGTASAWTTPRALTATGSVVGSVTMDGSSAVAMSLAAAVPGMRNRLINGNMLINQRAFGGGALAAGVYGYDRWKAGSGGANFSVSAAGLITHTSGQAVQVIEDNNAADLAGSQVTISVEDPSATVSVTMAYSSTNTSSVSGSIPAGSGRQSVTLTLPAGTGNLTVILSASSANYKRVQLEPGAVATAWDHRPRVVELALCNRYFWQGLPWGSGINTPIYTSGGYQSFSYSFPATMRTTPAMTISSSSWSTGNLNTNFGTNGVSVSPNVNGFRILVQSSAAAANCYVDWSGGGYFAADAEL